MPNLDLGPVVGPQGEQGATGAQGIRGEQGLPGPNQVTNSTATPLTGVLTGNGSVVGVANIDVEPTADSTGFAQSGGTNKAIKARIPVYGMGKNLLDNWYFGNPVNQRGENSYSAPGGRNYYTIDRWFVYSAGTAVSVGSGSVTLGPRSDGASSMTENLGIPFSEVAGKSMSISCLLADGSFIAASNTLPTTAPSSNTSIISAYGPSGSSGYFARLGYNNRFYFILQTPANTSLQVVAVKLELGTEQTLCHNEGTAEAPVWVLNEVPDYEYELYRCMTSTADSSDAYANKTLATGDDVSVVPITVTPNSNVDTSTIPFANYSYKVGRQVFINVYFSPAIARIQGQSFCSIPSAVCPAQSIPIFANVIMQRTVTSKTWPAIATVYSAGNIGFPNQGGYDETNNLTNNAIIYIQGTYYI